MVKIPQYIYTILKIKNIKYNLIKFKYNLIKFKNKLMQFVLFLKFKPV